MAYTAQLVKGSEDGMLLRPGELSTYRQRYQVLHNGSGGTLLEDAAAATGLPVPKVTRGKTIRGASFVCMALESLVKRLDHASTYDAVAIFGARVFTDIPFVKITRSHGYRLVDVWVDPSAFPTDFAAAFPPTSAEQITGTKVDVNGVPVVRYRVPQQTITVEVMVDGPAAKASAGSALVPVSTELDAYAFKRNSADFLGCKKGTLLFEGGDESTVDDIWRVRSYVFVFDQWGFMEQRPALAPDGSPMTGAYTTWPDGTQIYQATRAWWYQPYKTLTAFSSIVPAAVLAELDNPTPAL